MFLTSKKTKPDLLHSHYFILALGLALGAGLYFLFMGRLDMQTTIVIGTGLFYILWGTIHHASEGDFHLSIILEYTLIAGLAVALVLTLLVQT